MKDIRECDYARELLSAYRDGELDASERASVEDHLKDCAACRKELESVESVVRSLKTLPQVRLAKDFSADIESLIRKSEAPVQPVVRRPRAMWLAAAAAVVALIIAGGYFVTTGGGGGTMVATSSHNAAPAELKLQSPVVAEKPADSPVSKPIVAETPNAPESGASNDSPSSISDKKAVVAELPKTEKIASKIQKSSADSKTTKGSKAGAATKRSMPVDLNDLTEDEALLAFSDTAEGDLFDSEISTDEDGLYAIKM